MIFTPKYIWESVDKGETALVTKIEYVLCAISKLSTLLTKGKKTFKKIWPKKAKKKSLFGQNLIFLGKNAKIFKNKKLIKKVRKHSLDGKFLVIFVQKYFFYPC